MPISVNDTAATLHDKLAVMGARCILRALHENPHPVSQNQEQATYAAKISKAECVIDWTHDADEICRRIRAYNPAPGAHTTFEGNVLKIWHAKPAQFSGALPGTVLNCGADGIIVAAGNGAVTIEVLQKAGAKRMPADVFLAGTAMRPGTRLGA
jgi:methionyl-tRNA formyltransferase